MPPQYSQTFRFRQTAVEFVTAQRSRDPELLQHARNLAEVAGQPPSEFTQGLLSLTNLLIDKVAEHDRKSPLEVLADIALETEQVAAFQEDVERGE